MASYENLITEQTWQFRPEFADAWFSNDFTEDTETLTTALQSSFSGNSSNGDVLSAEIVESMFSKTVQTPTVSGGSENEIAVAPVSKKRRGGVPPTGRVSKRKPRGSKRSERTTFITADPENFMQMVQHVTGLRFGGSDEMLAAAPASEPARIKGVNREGQLPTFDTSAFLLDGLASSQSSPSSAVADGGGSAGAERLFDSCCSFPTLESWSLQYQQF